MSIKSPKGDAYQIGKLVAETPTYRLYLCKRVGFDSELLLQIAIDIGTNGKLDYFGYVLESLRKESERLEKEYAKIKDNPNHYLNYSLSFPTLIEGFIAPTQKSRRVNILQFSHINDVSKLIPLFGLVNKDKLRVDIRTSVWIMGKLLKIIAFAHDAGYAVGDLSLGNILIEPKLHYVIIFNWMNSQAVSKKLAAKEIRQAALSVIKVLGGSVQTGIPNDGSDIEIAYSNYLIDLATGRENSAFKAHKEFYSFVDTLWKRGYYQFTALPLR